MKTVWNPIGAKDNSYFNPDTMIDFYGDAQKTIFSHSITYIPARTSNPELTKSLEDAFTNANIDYKSFIFDYENVCDFMRNYKHKGYKFKEEDIEPLFRRGSMTLPIVILGQKYVISAEEVIKALQSQKQKNTFIMFGVDWLELFAINEWARTLTYNRMKATENDDYPDIPTPWELEQYDDLGLDPDEWDSPDQLDDDGTYVRRYNVQHQNKKDDYTVSKDVTPVDKEIPWWGFTPVIPTVVESDDLPF